MSLYLYKTTVHRQYESMAAPPESAPDILVDFENTKESSVLHISDVQVAETTFEIVKDYSDFCSIVSDWSSVKCITSTSAYDLFIDSGIPL